MRTHEIQACQKYYRRGVTAWGKLEEMLRAVLKAEEDRAAGRAKRRGLEDANTHLKVLGEALAVVPELVEDLAEERRIGEVLRRQAAKRGIVLRYEDFSD